MTFSVYNCSPFESVLLHEGNDIENTCDSNRDILHNSCANKSSSVRYTHVKRCRSELELRKYQRGSMEKKSTRPGRILTFTYDAGANGLRVEKLIRRASE